MKKIFVFFWLIGLTPLFAGEVGFLFFGDQGTATPSQYRVAESMVGFCENNLCDFVALLGDNFYPSGVSSISDRLWRSAFEEPYKDLQIPFYATLGNHDYKGNIKAQIDYTKKSSVWRMPSKYYSFSKGDVDFFVLDTNDFTKTQKSWLESEIQKSKNRWKVVYGHHPIFSYGGHGNNETLKNELLPILEGRIDFYLSGHDHSKQVIQKKSSDLTFIVSGAAAQTEPVKRSRLALYNSATLGFAHFLITKNKAILKFLDKTGNLDYTQTFDLE
jgi:DNA repair exonuclease SbcCD nuclease subunit